MTENLEPDFSHDIRGNINSSLSWVECKQALRNNFSVMFQVSRQLFQILELKDPELFSRLNKLYDLGIIKGTLCSYLRHRIPSNISIKDINVNLLGCPPLIAFCGAIQIPLQDLHDLFLLHMIPRQIIYP